MTKKILSLTLSVLAGVFIMMPAQAEAQDLRIGVVDATLVLAEMPELTLIQDQLEGFTTRKRREFAQLETNYLQAQEEFEQKVAVISETAREAEQERIAQMARRLQQFQQEYQQELISRQEELIQPLRTRIMNAINEVSKELELTYVLNRMVNNGDMVVLYMSDEMESRYDITDRVKQRVQASR